MSACQDRKVVRKTVNLINILIIMITKENIENILTFPQIRIYDTSQMGFKLVQTIEAQVKNPKSSLMSCSANKCNVFSILNALYHQITPQKGCWLERTRCGLESRRRSPCLFFLV